MEYIHGIAIFCAPPDLRKPVLSQRKNVSYNKWNWTYIEKKRKIVIRALYPCLVLKRKGQCRKLENHKCVLAMNLSFFFFHQWIGWVDTFSCSEGILLRCLTVWFSGLCYRNFFFKSFNIDRIWCGYCVWLFSSI